jgi:predicted acetyltransferase
VADDAGELTAGAVVHVVQNGEWSVVAWLWQAFRQDLSPVVGGLPYADGRFGAAPLQGFPSDDGVGYVVRRPHPNTGEQAPVAFALVSGVRSARWSMAAFWIAAPVRRTGLGRAFALDVLRRHPAPWEIGFQHDNAAAGGFWRRVADEAFGPGRWSEVEEPVPGKPDVPPDHFIRTTG